MNAEFQRRVREDKKGFLSEQCEEIDKNQRSLQENQRYQGNISSKDEHNKAQKWYGPNKSNIKKKWQEYTELYKKDLNDPDNHDGVVIHLEPDILECEIKWA